MLKEALQYLVSLKGNETYDINGDTYSDKELVRIAPHIDRPAKITVNGLDSIVKLIRNEIDVIEFQPIFIRVENARNVSVFTTYDDTMTRDNLYAACCDVPEFKAGTRPHEQGIIELRSKFIENEGSLYLLDLLSSISKEQGVTSADNGVSQEVTARSGIALSQKVSVKSRVALRPYRTFLEVDQPESEFLLRLTDDGDVSLYEADGGMWVMEAKNSISAYFQQQLSDLVEAGKVVVMV
jgi:hypothetical protein